MVTPSDRGRSQGREACDGEIEITRFDRMVCVHSPQAHAEGITMFIWHAGIGLVYGIAIMYVRKQAVPAKA